MKSVNHVFEIAKSERVRRIAVHKVLRKARKAREFEKYAEDEEGTVRKAEKWLEVYYNDTHKPKTIYDGMSHKKRTIIVPTTRELIVQHCIVEALKPMFFRGMYRHSYASIPARRIFSGNYRKNGRPIFLKDVRGGHSGKKAVDKWLKDRKNTKYVLKMDIKHFFDTIPHDKLKEMLALAIHDQKMLNLLFTIIDVIDEGIPLGFYSSQWLANWYLQGLDHYIKEGLHAKYYIRYMDDMVIFASNKRKLHKMREAVEKYLNDVLGLELKENWQVFRFVYTKSDEEIGRDLDFMGFRFFRNRTILRKSILLKTTRKAKRISKKKFTSYDARQMMSYNGYLKHTDSYNVYQNYIEPYIDFKKLKKKISNSDKRRAQ